MARHYRDHEALSTAEIARRLGRAPATVKAYCMTRLMLTKGPAGNGRPSQEVASSGVTRPARHHEETPFPDGRCSALGWLSSTGVSTTLTSAAIRVISAGINSQASMPTTAANPP